MFTIGLIREGKIPADNRVAFTPDQCKWIKHNLPVRIVVQSSSIRCFSDREYLVAGVDVQEDISGSNGKVLAAKNGVIKEGNWSESPSSQRLVIDLGIKSDANKPLGELSDDWVITSKTETKINLTDDNASSNELLEFTKN